MYPLSGEDIIAGGGLLDSFVESLSRHYWPEEEEILLEKKIWVSQEWSGITPKPIRRITFFLKTAEKTELILRQRL